MSRLILQFRLYFTEQDILKRNCTEEGGLSEGIIRPPAAGVFLEVFEQGGNCTAVGVAAPPGASEGDNKGAEQELFALWSLALSISYFFQH